jgi:hypothetical protein
MLADGIRHESLLTYWAFDENMPNFSETRSLKQQSPAKQL